MSLTKDSMILLDEIHEFLKDNVDKIIRTSNKRLFHLQQIKIWAEAFTPELALPQIKEELRKWEEEEK